ncbi:hypothetical protein BDW22DRAFT_1000688 [Trametopsis cervina]|nr:hypothetical protein BDW22DRAFT_1000688 [Trametopsis cervina]
MWWSRIRRFLSRATGKPARTPSQRSASMGGANHSTAPRGILKTSHTHDRTMSSNAKDHARRVTTSSSLESRREGSPVFFGTDDLKADTRTRPRWIQTLVSAFHHRRPHIPRSRSSSDAPQHVPRTPNYPEPTAPRSTTPVAIVDVEPPTPLPMSTSQISLPSAAPQKRRASSGSHAAARWRARSPGMRSSPHFPHQALSVTTDRRLGSFDFER